MKMENSGPVVSLSRRSQKTKSSTNFLAAAWYKQHENPYDAESNPEGIINLGTAENKVLFDIIQRKLCDIKLGNLSEEYTHYCKLSGTDQFRSKLSNFFNRFMKPKESIIAEETFVMNGCGTVVESLGYALCDEGEAIMIPAPFYAGFKSDLEQRVGVKAFPVHLSSKTEKPFQLTRELLEDAFESAEEQNITIKALLLANPNNPLGTLYTKKELEVYAEFCYNYGIHLICDEIYMLSVYDQCTTFNSILSIDNFEKYRDIVHVVWGFSKDFGLSGFRCGVAITKNADLQDALTSVGYYTSVPTVTQYILEDLITDTQWLDKLMCINHKRLQNSRKVVTKELSKANIDFVYPNSGLFIWINLSQFLKASTKEAEMELFETLMGNGLYIVPGLVFENKEYGWFRIIISDEAEILKVAVNRILKSIGQSRSKIFVQCGTRRHAEDTVHALEASVRPHKLLTKLNSTS